MNRALAITLLAVALAGASVCAQAQDWADRRTRMVEEQIAARNVEDPAVLEAMRTVPRHRFVPEPVRSAAYQDRPLPIGEEQTISQPYIVAYMTAAIRPDSTDRVLEVGTGSGYQAAILGEIVETVKTIEIRPELGRRARDLLDSLGYANVEVRIGNGFKGWPEHAPYDGIVVTAAPEEVPDALIRQLAPGGRLVVPVGPTGSVQQLTLIHRQEDGSIERRTLTPVRFVPMIRSLD